MERLKPFEEKHEVTHIDIVFLNGVLLVTFWFVLQEERSKVDDLRGVPMAIGSMEELMEDDQHAIVSTSMGSEHYVHILSFVDKVPMSLL